MKTVIWAGMIIGSLVGGYIPILLGSSELSFTTVIGNCIGGLVGIFLGFKLGNYLEF